jgi:hypothetical protein
MEVAASRAAGGGSAARVATETPIDGDDTMLARKALAHIETGSGPAWSSFLSRFLLAPSGLAACAAAVLIAATVAGYQVARLIL